MFLNIVVKKNYIMYFRNYVCLLFGLFIFLFFLVFVLLVINFYGFGGKYFCLN